MARKRIVMNGNLDRAITVEKIRAYQSYMLNEKQYSPTTINVRLRTLKAYFHWLYNEGYIDDKLYKGIKKANENPCGSVTTFTKRRYNGLTP